MGGCKCRGCATRRDQTLRQMAFLSGDTAAAQDNLGMTSVVQERNCKDALLMRDSLTKDFMPAAGNNVTMATLGDKCIHKLKGIFGKPAAGFFGKGTKWQIVPAASTGICGFQVRARMLGLTPDQEHEWHQAFSPAMLTEFKRFQNNPKNWLDADMLLNDVLEHDVRYHGDGVHLLYIRIIINMSIIPELCSHRVCVLGAWVHPHSELDATIESSW